MTTREEVAEIVNRIGPDHGFEFDSTSYFKTADGASFFEVGIRPSPNSILREAHYVGIRVDGRSVRAMAIEAAQALADWADSRTLQERAKQKLRGL